jgi:solute carrier family 25 protein 44
MSGVPKEVTWGSLDKTKFFVTGAGMFSGVTCMLYPLTVIKTRQMVDGSGKSLGGVAIVRDIVKQRGILGLYQGFGTIVVGTLPIRMVYLSTLVGLALFTTLFCSQNTKLMTASMVPM